MGWIHIVRLHDTLYTLNDGGILAKTTPHALQPSAPEGLPQENSVGGGGGGEHGASEVTAVEIDSLLPRFLELVFPQLSFTEWVLQGVQ